MSSQAQQEATGHLAEAGSHLKAKEVLALKQEHALDVPESIAKSNIAFK